MRKAQGCNSLGLFLRANRKFHLRVNGTESIFMVTTSMANTKTYTVVAAKEFINKFLEKSDSDLLAKLISQLDTTCPASVRNSKGKMSKVYRKGVSVGTHKEEQEKPKNELYSVHGYDSFSGEGYPIKSGLTLDEARELAKQKGGTMNIVYVHDSNNKVVDRYGTF